MALFGTLGLADLARQALPTNLRASTNPFSFDYTKLTPIGKALVDNPDYAATVWLDYANQLAGQDRQAAALAPRLYDDVYGAYKVAAAQPGNEQLTFADWRTGGNANLAGRIKLMSPYDRGDREQAYSRGFRFLRA